MLLLGAHRIDKGTFSSQTCAQIVNNGGLLVGTNTAYGAGVYAYYPDKIPRRFRGDPFVVFEVPPQIRTGRVIKDIYVVGVSTVAGETRFFMLPGAMGNIVQVAILGFINCPNFAPYPGTLTFV